MLGADEAFSEMAPTAHGMAPPVEPAIVFARQAVYTFDASTPIVAGTYRAARSAVDVALTAADAVLEGDGAAYGLCRPRGHHAPSAALGGFCYLNNAAIAAQHVVERASEPVAILERGLPPRERHPADLL